jgi:hypothetical protein
MSMPPPCTILIAADIVEILLTQNSPNRELYLNFIRQLESQSVIMYMSDLDWDFAVGLPSIYRVTQSDHFQEAYELLQRVIRIFPVSRSILRYARTFQLEDPYHSIRLALASEHGLEAIVTRAPLVYIGCEEDYTSLNEFGYFDIHLPSEMADDGKAVSQCIRVFSVDLFRQWFSFITPH